MILVSQVNKTQLASNVTFCRTPIYLDNVSVVCSIESEFRVFDDSFDDSFE